MPSTVRHLLHVCETPLSVPMKGQESNELIQTPGLYSRQVLVAATVPTSSGFLEVEVKAGSQPRTGEKVPKG